MKLLKLMGKVLAFPVMLIVTVIQYAVLFLTGFSSIVFNLFAGLILLVAVLSLAFGIATWPETIRTALAGFLVFMVPVIGEGIAAVIVVLREGLSDFIRS